MMKVSRRNDEVAADWDLSPLSVLERVGAGCNVENMLNEIGIYTMGDFRYYTIVELLCVYRLGVETIGEAVHWLGRHDASMLDSPPADDEAHAARLCYEARCALEGIVRAEGKQRREEAYRALKQRASILPLCYLEQSPEEITWKHASTGEDYTRRMQPVI